MARYNFLSFRKTAAWACHRDLLSEWITVFLAFGLFIGLEFKPPFERMFSLSDLEIQHPFTEHERVPVWLLGVIAFSIPLVSFFIGSALSPHKRYYFVLLHVSILAFAISVLVNGFVTNFLKVWIGRPRPDFLARCQPRDGTNVDGLVTVEVCTTSDQSKLEDGFKSLPSGHASISFSSFYFLSLWMAGQLNVFSPDAVNGTNGTSVKALICFYPILLAAFVAISRTEDYRHRGSDIIAGTLIGTVIAWISYRMFFPPLAAPDCDTPYVLRQVLFEEAESQEYQSSGETPRFESTGYEPSVFENASYERTRPRPPQQPQEPPIQERELTEFDISNRV